MKNIIRINPHRGERTAISALFSVVVSFLVVTNAYAAGGVSGRVFRDYNANGVRDTYEPGVGGVTVTAYDAAGNNVGSTVTAANGTYSLTVAVDQVRIEVTGLPAYLQPGPKGTDSETTVTFVTSPASGVDIGVNNPVDYCEANPYLCAPELISGDTNTIAPTGTVQIFPYNSSQTSAQGYLGSLPYVHTPIADKAEVGSTWGLAWQRSTKTVYAAAFLKRHSGLGPNGLGAMYMIPNATSATPGTPTLFFDLATVTNTGTVLNNAARGLGSPSVGSHDPSVIDDIGKIGLGDIDISDDESMLWAVSLNDKTLYAIPTTAPNPANVTGYAIPNPGCVNGVWRPFAVKYYAGNVYVGGVCDASTGTSANLRAYIYRFNGSSFTSVLNFPLNYNRGLLYTSCSANWRPWSDVWHAACNANMTAWPQPILSDIEFDTDGSMIIGMMDRYGHQTGASNYSTTAGDTAYYYGLAGGDTLRAYNNNGTFVLENNATAGPNTTAGAGNNQGPGGGEYYVGDSAQPIDHAEKGNGGLALIPGKNEVALTTMDPVRGLSGGVTWYNNTTGQWTRGYEFYFVNPYAPDRAYFGKAHGLGDLEALCSAAPIEVGNRLWIDTNANGIQDPGETPLSGVTVQLYNSGGTLLASAVTSANGEYFFSSDPTRANTTSAKYNIAGLSQNTTGFEIRVDMTQASLNSYALTTTNADTTTNGDMRDSDAILSGTTAVISFDTAGAGANNHTYDIGFSPMASLGDYVWLDANADGIQDAGEAGFPGVDVFLYKVDGTPAGTTTTDANGYYRFTNLTPGDYYIEVAHPAGYEHSPLDQGGDDTKDSDIDPTLHRSIMTTLVAGENDLTWDAGLSPIKAQLGDLVWLDANANGIQDTGEAGVPNVTVNLYDINNALVGTTTTDANGNYLFNNLLPGEYSLEFIAPAGYVISPQNQGVNDTLDSDTEISTGQTIHIILTPAQTDLTWDAGLYQPASLGDRVWLDVDGDGVQDIGENGVTDVTVKLYKANGTLAGTTTTDANGNYSFTNLKPGDYYVEVTPPTGYVVTLQDQGADDTVDSDIDSVTYRAITTTLVSGENDPTWDAGLIQLASLGNLVWLDDNQNGIQNAGENGIAGVTVQLYTAAGTLVKTTITDVNGNYSFINLLPGDYYVAIHHPNGYEFSPQDQGGNDAVDSDIDLVTERTATTTLIAGENDPTWDAGIFFAGQITPAIGDFVWLDVDADGIQDPGESGIPGVIVNLLDSNGNPLPFPLTTTTDANGYYSFGNLDLGNYIVEFIPPTGYSLSPQNTGSNDTLDSDADVTTGQTIPVTLSASDQMDTTWDAGLYQPASLGDYVWNDLNADGVQDAGESGIPNVTVNLYDQNNNLVGTTTTDATGHYQFTNLVPGGYYVEFVPPAGHFLSPAHNHPGGNDTIDSDADPVSGKTTITTLVSGENDPTWDAGMYQLATIGDYIWLDANYNGVQDAGESGIPNVTVNLYLYDINGTLIATTTTDANGYYEFTGLQPGNYFIEVAQPTGYEFSPQDQGSDDTLDSDLNPLTHHLPVTTLVSGENDSTWDIGLYQPASIGDFVWLDADADGIQDAGEVGVPGITVKLYDGAGTLKSTMVTDATGHYAFVNLVPGDYYLEFSHPNTYEHSPQNQGADDALDSDVDHATERTTTTTLNPGENDSTWDLGMYQFASLGNYLWEDMNANGIQEAGEPGIPGVIVNLYDANGSLVKTATTEISGYYQFTGLIPSDYTVEFVPPAGYVVTAQDQGADNSKDSDADSITGKTAPVNLISGENDLTIDAGMYQSASLGDYVWLDTDIDGIQEAGELGVSSVTVNLYDANNTLINTTTTDANGYYQFTNLTPGDYHVEFIAPAGYFISPQDQGGDNATDSDADLITGLTVVTTLDSGEHDPTWDLGLYQLASLGDYVWLDANVNGIQETGETGVSGVTVNLYNTSGLAGTTTTDASGYYQFTNLVPGNYYVEFVPPAGYALTLQDQGSDDTVDSDAYTDTNPVLGLFGKTALTALLSGENDPTWDAGLYQAASLGNYVWEDTNQNGIQDESNTGIPNVTVKLYDVNNALVDTTITDASGYYQFANLIPGDYHVEVVPPANYTISLQDQGGDDALDSDIDPATGLTILTTLDSGENDLTWDAGLYHTLAALGDYVWSDYNHNGIQDAGEPGIPNVTVNLINAASGNVIATQQTDANGYYLFANLDAGNYIVRVDIPAGYVATLQTSGNTSTDSNIDAIGFMAEVTLDWGETNLTLDAGLYRPSGIAKTILSTDQIFTSDTDVAIGEIITYQITMTVSPGPHEAMQLVDTMDNGLAFVRCASLVSSDSAMTTDLTNGFADACDPAQTDPTANPKVQNGGRIVTWDLGIVTNGTGQDQTLTLTYEVVVLDILSNQTGVTLNNSASWSFTGQAETVVNATEVKIIEPNLSITKTVNSTNVPYGAPVTFTLSINHTSDSLTDAYDVVVTDILPPSLTFVPGVINTTGLAPTSVNYDASSKSLTFVWDTFPLNATTTVSFTTIFNGPAPVSNVANVAWTSLEIDPGPTGPIQFSPYNPDSTERWYDPADSASINNYGAAASVKIGLPNLPDTGFAPDHITTLPAQPKNKTYSAYGDTWLEIPSLGLKTSIMGVPLAGDGWDVTWLGKNVGYLQGTAFPGLSGNSVLSAHVYDANGLPGPFINLYQLKYGDRFMIHAMGQVYIYEVRSNALFLPFDNSPLKHKKEAWITLLTCQGYNESRDTYQYRRAVQAVLISIAEEK